MKRDVSDGAEGRRRYRRLMSVIWLPLLLLVGAATCSAGPKPKPDDSVTEEKADRPIRPDSDQQKVAFEDAMAALKAGEWTKAKESFRLIQAERETDSVADLAELYIARAELGALEGLSQEGSRGQAERAVRMLEALRDDEAVDDRVRRAAGLYGAYARRAFGADEEAYGAFADYPDGQIGSAVLQQDQTRLAPLLVEGLYRQQRWLAAVEAAALLYELAGRGGEEAESERVTRRPTEMEETEERAGSEKGEGEKGEGEKMRLRRFARARGFDAAQKLDDGELEGHLDAETSFERAVVGWAYLNGRLDADSFEDEERRRVEKRLADVSADLTAIGAPDRVGELSVKMATIGGARRLVLGAVLPFEGASKAIGQRAMSGMLLAMRALQHRGASRVTLVFEDSTDEPARVMKRLDEAGAMAVIGPLDGARAEAFAPLAAEREIPLVSLTAKSAETPPDADKPFALRNFMEPGTEARAVANLAFHELGDRRVAVVYPEVGYGRFVQKAFSETFRALGGQVVVSIGYKRDKSNYAPLARRVAKASPDAVFIPDSASKVAEVSAFLANEDVWGIAHGEEKSDDDRTYVHYLGTSLWNEPILTRQAANYIDGAVVPAWYAAPFKDSATQRFGRRFQAVFARKPGDIEAFAYDNVAWLRSLMLERGIHQRDLLHEALLEGASFTGATGEASFDRRGRLRRAVRFVTVGEEGFEAFPMQVEVEPVEPAGEEADTNEETDEEAGGDGSAPGK